MAFVDGLALFIYSPICAKILTFPRFVDAGLKRLGVCLFGCEIPKRRVLPLGIVISFNVGKQVMPGGIRDGLNLHQNPDETLHIRRLENGLERPLRPLGREPGHFSSLVEVVVIGRS
jgi:hypothetical protein